MKNPLKVIWILLGFLCLGLGTIGMILPILPTVPFYMETSGQFCSEKSHDNGNKMQDYRNGNSSYADRFYLYEGCTDWKNLYRNCVGMPSVIFLLKG